MTLICSSRYVLITTYAKGCTANISQSFCNEIYVQSLLHREGVDVVPLVGVYSTEKNPLCLVYEYMEGLNLGNYLKNKPVVGGRLKLVLVSLHALSQL